MASHSEQVYTTMELRMKCGLGKCGRCNIGDKYVCKDGPVFRFDQLDELPQTNIERRERNGKHGERLPVRQEI